MAMRIFDTDIGQIGVEGDADGIKRIYFAHEHMPAADKPNDPVLMEAEKQIKAYLNGELRVFTLPLRFKAAPYTQSVWKALMDIPYGHTRTYGEIAGSLGNKHAARAVGLACNRNPLPLVVPCHRVVGASGALTGFRGGLEVKARLLEMEGQ